jgi:uncharacterized protein YcaQ
MGPHLDIQDVYRTIEALMVIHNMAIDFGDRPSDKWCLEENPDDQMKTMAIMNPLFPMLWERHKCRRTRQTTF